MGSGLRPSLFTGWLRRPGASGTRRQNQLPLRMQVLEDRVMPHGPGFAIPDVPFGVFTPEQIEAMSVPVPVPNFSTHTPRLRNGGHQSDVLTIVLDFKEPTQTNTS